ncbi:MAG: CHAT domain-containing protein, partial [Flavobacteriaceae bacterium]
KKADSLSPFFKLSKNNFQALNFTYAKYFQNNLTFDLKKSKYYYQKVLKNALINNDASIVIKVCNNIGGLLNKVKNDSAYYYINKGIKLSKVTEQSLPKLYYQLSEYYINKNELLSALKNIDKATSLVIIYKPIQLLKVDDFSFSNQKPLLFRLIKLKTIILLKLYKETSDNKYLISALKNLFHADKLLDAIKQESIETKSKLFWQQEASEIYLQGVKISQLLNKPEDAFYFMEKNKALLLLENISEIQIRKQANIPISVLENELELKQKINSLEKELNENPKQKDSLENEYYTSKIDLTKFIQSLKKEYPTYYKYKKPVDIVKLNDVQSKLDDETIILEYILNENDGYVLAITNEKTSLHKLDSVESIHNNIAIYRTLIAEPISTTKKQIEYNSIAHELYNSLFPFIKSAHNKNKILVISDNALQNIPFESLMFTKDNKDYLINKYEISYAYSLSFDKINKTKSDKASKYFIGFAPNSFDYNDLSPLKNSIVELNSINQYFKGTIYIDSSATKSNFINNANDSNIIHLATHANANDSIAPWIAFKNNPLYLNELYTFQNKADLVVLSACKTSLGKTKPGEGVFSLARGFFYGGAKSVVSSLWNVNDKATQEILSVFYAHLKNGKSKSEALRLAKLNYINSHQLSEQSPYYWSSFILIGDTDAIEMNSFSEYYPYFFILFLIILGLYLFKKKIM